ncbi:7838_t:CDS:1, partial [Dentiscutata erythropus]
LRDSYQNNVNRTNRGYRQSIVCYNCQQNGHITQDCPNRSNFI